MCFCWCFLCVRVKLRTHLIWHEECWLGYFIWNRMMISKPTWWNPSLPHKFHHTNCSVEFTLSLLHRYSGPLHTRDWEPVTITFQALSLAKSRSRSKFASQYPWGTNGVCECKMDVKSTWISTCHRTDHVSWFVFKNHLLEVGLTQNRETMALEMLTTVDLFYIIMHRTCMNKKSLK